MSLEDQLEERPTDELRQSERYLNYAKAVGAIIAAATGIFGMVVAVWHPSEPVAKAGYRVVEKGVAGLSQDVQVAFEDRKLLKERLDHLQGQMKLLLDTMHAYMEARPAPRRRRRTRGSSTSTRAPTRAPASTSTSTPKTLLDTALRNQKEMAHVQAQRPLAKPPPNRSLPALQQMQEQAERKSAF